MSTKWKLNPKPKANKVSFLTLFRKIKTRGCVQNSRLEDGFCESDQTTIENKERETTFILAMIWASTTVVQYNMNDTTILKQTPPSKSIGKS